MPSAALTRACVYGCRNDARTCPTHGRKAKQQAYDDRRGSASSRGYDARWATFRQAYISQLFALNVPRAGLCGARLPGATLTTDSVCAVEGLTTLGRVLDHIVPVTGPDDPNFYNLANLQLLCDGVTGRGCHDAKRQREARR